MSKEFLNPFEKVELEVIELQGLLMIFALGAAQAYLDFPIKDLEDFKEKLAVMAYQGIEVFLEEKEIQTKEFMRVLAKLTLAGEIEALSDNLVERLAVKNKEFKDLE